MKKNNVGKRLSEVLLRPGNQNGAALLFFISMILVCSVLAGSMLDLKTTSTLGELSFNHLERAYFMAEAGGSYANRLVKQDIETDTTYDDDYLINGRTFTVDEAGGIQNGQFAISVDDSNSAYTLVYSTGTINASISSNVEVKLTYSMTKTSTSSSVFEESIFSGNEMKLKKNVTITGDVGTNDTSISKNKGVTITGDEETSVGKTLDSISFSCSGCNSDYEISKNGSAEWWAGTYEYENVNMGKNSSLWINGDVVLYVKEDFIAEKNTSIVIRSSSSLILYVDNKAEFGQNFSVVFNPTPDRAEDFVIYGTSNADTIKFKQNTTFIGAIYAPDADITIEKNSQITGSIIGDKIKVGKNAHITYDSDVSNISTPIGGSGGIVLGNPVQYFSS